MYATMHLNMRLTKKFPLHVGPTLMIIKLNGDGLVSSWIKAWGHQFPGQKVTNFNGFIRC